MSGDAKVVLQTVGTMLGGVTWRELCGQRRWPSFDLARKACALALRRRGLSYPEIGRAMGGRDHSTIMNAVKRAVLVEAGDERFAAAVADGVRVGGRPACVGACSPACPTCVAECSADCCAPVEVACSGLC